MTHTFTRSTGRPLTDGYIVPPVHAKAMRVDERAMGCVDARPMKRNINASKALPDTELVEPKRSAGKRRCFSLSNDCRSLR